MLAFDEAIPTLSDTLVPPTIRGAGDLTTFAYQGNGYEALLERIGPEIDPAAYLYDKSLASQLAFRRAEGMLLQSAALERAQIYRVGTSPEGALRLLALVSPGDLMTNTPLDFLTNHLNVRLDLLYIYPDGRCRYRSRTTTSLFSRSGRPIPRNSNACGICSPGGRAPP